jgi:hypothetical protein
MCMARTGSSKTLSYSIEMLSVAKHLAASQARPFAESILSVAIMLRATIGGGQAIRGKRLPIAFANKV